MIDTNTTANTFSSAEQSGRKVLTMVKNERMGGYVPKWSEPETAKQQIQQNLEHATYDPQSNAFQSALASQNRNYNSAGQEEFGFGDLVDMVNPLQHVPIVSHLYREVTGDDIKPIGRIIGGAVFGGPMGAASSLVNTVIEEETGTDIAGNLTAMVLPERKPAPPTTTQTPPEHNLEQAQDIAAQSQDLSESLLSFTQSTSDTYRAERFEHFKQLHNQTIRELAAIPDQTKREEITRLAAFTMPKT